MSGSPFTLRRTTVRAIMAAAVALLISACADSPTSPALQAPDGAQHDVGLTELEVTACAPGETGDWPDCVSDEPPPIPYTYPGPTGGGGSGSGTGGAGPVPEDDGPILATIICLTGLGFNAFAMHDVYDQMKVTLLSKLAYDQAQQRLGAYLSTYGPASTGPERTELEQRVTATRDAYHGNVHTLSDKLGVSAFTLFAGIVSCGAALAAPTP